MKSRYCTQCSQKPLLEVVKSFTPFTEIYLQCPVCDSTYNIEEDESK